jgi:hypothetical protein
MDPDPEVPKTCGSLEKTIQKKTVLEWEWQCTATESNDDVPACLKKFFNSSFCRL